MRPTTTTGTPLSVTAALGALLLAATGVAHAGFATCTFCSAPTVTGQSGSSGDRDTTQVYGGVQWTFGQGPELVLGVRASHTNASNKSAGARLEAAFPFSSQAISFDKLRLRIFGGSRTILPELGLGYSFASGHWLMSGAVQTDYAILGTDFVPTSGQWQPFVGVNTLRRPKAPKASGSALACDDANAVLVPVDGPFVGQNIVAPEDQVNGYTCAFAV